MEQEFRRRKRKGLRQLLGNLLLSAFILFLLLCPASLENDVKPMGVAEILKRTTVESPSPTIKSIRFIIRSTVTFVNNGSSTWSLTEEDKAIGFFMNNSWQTVLLINHSHPLETIAEDEDDNLVAILDLQRYLEPGEKLTYSVSYDILSKPRIIADLDESNSGTVDEIPEYLREKYCTSESPWLTDNEDIRKTASKIAGNETRVLTVIKKFVAWIWENIRYPSQPHEVPFYPNETLENKEGDCDDQAILFITFCRIYGIPSFIQVGCVHLPRFYANTTAWNEHVRHELKQIGWHGWAMAYIPPWGWLPIDLTFVMGSLDDSINAIKNGAVTLQETIQYMNISKTDYVASTRTYRNFLQQNNFCLYSTDEMIMTLLGDLNGDFVVNILDIAIVAELFGSKAGEPAWNDMADVAEPYGLINIIDVAQVAVDFGKTV